MKIPDENLLKESEHNWFRHLDCVEFFENDRNNFYHLRYISRFNKIMQAIQSLSSGSAILDIGCATANLGLFLAEKGFKVFALDLKLSFLTYAKMKYEYGKIYFINADLFFPPFEKAFDAIILGDVIEHLAFPERALSIIAGLLKEDGILVINTPNGDFIRQVSPRIGNAGDRKILAKRQYYPGGDGHLFSLNKLDLVKIVNQQKDFKIIYFGYYNTPWITGNMKLRYLRKFFPLKVFSIMNRFFLGFPLIRVYFSEGLIMVLKKLNKR